MTNNQARTKLKAIDTELGRFYDALTDSLTQELDRINVSGVAKLVTRLNKDLEFDTNGRIAKTPANLARIGKLDGEFSKLADELGRRKAISAFVGEFPGQLTSISKQLDIISGQLKGAPIKAKKILAAPAAKKMLLQQQSMAVADMHAVVAQVATTAKRKVQLQYGALGREEMADMLSATLSRSVGETRTLGATSLAMFHRVANERVMDQVDPQGKLLYVYDGPDDKLTRPFCAQLKKQMKKGRTWTRAEIDQMQNGQLADCFTTGGGYNCRHQWRLALPDEIKPVQPALFAAKGGVEKQALQSLLKTSAGNLTVETARTPGEQTRLALDTITVNNQAQAIEEATGADLVQADAVAEALVIRQRQAVYAPDAPLEQMQPQFKSGLFGVFNKWSPAGRQSVQEGLDEFARMVGAGNIDNTAARALQIRYDTGGRESYRDGTLYVSENTPVSVIVHEMGHWLEDVNPGIHRDAVEFLLRRTKGEQEQSMAAATGNRDYGTSETTLKDKFRHAYVGKLYRNNSEAHLIKKSNGAQVTADEEYLATEVVSTGLQWMYENPAAFAAEDPEHFDFIKDVLARHRNAQAAAVKPTAALNAGPFASLKDNLKDTLSKVKTSKPYKPGSMAAGDWDAIADGMTVEQALKAVKNKKTVYDAIEKGYLSVAAKPAPAQTTTQTPPTTAKVVPAAQSSAQPPKGMLQTYTAQAANGRKVTYTFNPDSGKYETNSSAVYEPQEIKSWYESGYLDQQPAPKKSPAPAGMLEKYTAHSDTDDPVTYTYIASKGVYKTNKGEEWEPHKIQSWFDKGYLDQKPAPAAKAAPLQVPVPAGMPASVVSNTGHTYEWNTATGQYESPTGNVTFSGTSVAIKLKHGSFQPAGQPAAPPPPAPPAVSYVPASEFSAKTHKYNPLANALTSNPYKAGSMAASDWKVIQQSATVAEALKGVQNSKTVAHAIQKGYVQVVDPTGKAAVSPAPAVAPAAAPSPAVSKTQPPLTQPTPKPPVQPAAQGAPLTWTKKAVQPVLGGAHPKSVWTDAQGNDWLFKPSEHGKEIIPWAEEAASNVAKLINPVTAVDARTVTLNGEFGSIQKMMPTKPKKDFTAGTGGNKPMDLSLITPAEYKQIQQEQVTDWLLSNHDGHPAQFLRGADGNVYGIDKAQAFKHLGEDKLSVDYHPNAKYGEQEPFYNTIFRAVKQGTLKTLNPMDTLPAIQAVEALSDAAYVQAIEKYADFLVSMGVNKGQFLTKALQRKHSIRADFEKYYAEVFNKPGFKFESTVAAPPPPAQPKESAAQVQQPRQPLKPGELLDNRAKAIIPHAVAAGWQGKTLAIDKDMIEDQNVLVVQEQDGTGYRTVLRMKIRPGAPQEKVVAALGLDAAQLKQPGGAAVKALPPDLELVEMPWVKSKHLFKKMVTGTVTVDSPDSAYVDGYQKPFTPEEIAAVKQQYLTWKTQVDAEKAKLKKAAATEAKQQLPPNAPAFKLQRVQGVTVDTRAITGRGQVRVEQKDKLASDMYQGAGVSLNSYMAKWSDGATVHYVPYHDNNEEMYAYQGTLEINLPGKATEQTVTHALSKLQEIGIHAASATATDTELLYLQKQAYVSKVHNTPEWKQILNSTRDKSDEDKIVAMRAYWSRRLGVPDVTKLKAYNPDGEYEHVWNSNAMNDSGAGYRHHYRFDISDDDIQQRLKNYRIAHDTMFGRTPLDVFIERSLAHNRSLVSTSEKIRTGITRAGGGSPTSDLNTGGASYVFTRIRKSSFKDVDHLFWHPRVLRRMDAISYAGDKWGKTTGDTVENFRAGDVDEFIAHSKGGSNELNFKYTLNYMYDLDKMVARDEDQRRRILTLFRDEGITHWPDGRPIEQVVQT